MDAVGVHEDDAEDGGEEAEGERLRREALLLGELLLARVVVPVEVRLRLGEEKMLPITGHLRSVLSPDS